VKDSPDLGQRNRREKRHKRAAFKVALVGKHGPGRVGLVRDRSIAWKMQVRPVRDLRGQKE
jgi:hypothetical protein